MRAWPWLLLGLTLLLGSLHLAEDSRQQVRARDFVDSLRSRVVAAELELDAERARVARAIDTLTKETIALRARAPRIVERVRAHVTDTVRLGLDSIVATYEEALAKQDTIIAFYGVLTGHFEAHDKRLHAEIDSLSAQHLLLAASQPNDGRVRFGVQGGIGIAQGGFGPYLGLGFTIPIKLPRLF